jgi:hypothetical protein
MSYIYPNPENFPIFFSSTSCSEVGKIILGRNMLFDKSCIRGSNEGLFEDLLRPCKKI